MDLVSCDIHLLADSASATPPAGMGKSSLYRGVTLFRPTGKWRAQVCFYDQIREFRSYLLGKACSWVPCTQRPCTVNIIGIILLQYWPSSRFEVESSWHGILGLGSHDGRTTQVHQLLGCGLTRTAGFADQCQW